MKTIMNYSLSNLFRTIVFAVVFLFSFSLFAQEETSPGKKNSVNLGLCYPISNHGTLAGKYSNVFSLNLLVGLSKEETGASIAGLSNIVKENASGAQIAGFNNYVGGNSSGVLISGFLNQYDSAKGGQIAGFTNLALGSVKGLQLAGFLNIAKDQNAAQIAGFSNLANKTKGLQLSGFFNKADDVEGAQVAGFINIAKNVKGVQLAGFINIADSSDYSIGVVNIIKTGEKSISISTDETSSTVASFRSGGRVLYSIIGVGYNFENDDQKYALEGGIGANLYNKGRFRLRAEGVTLTLTDFDNWDYSRSSLRVLPSFKLNNRFEIYAGPTINHVHTTSTEGKDMIKNYLWDETSGNRLNGVYVGVSGGLNFIL
jgi:hypothetical protein